MAQKKAAPAKKVGWGVAVQFQPETTHGALHISKQFDAAVAGIVETRLDSPAPFTGMYEVRKIEGPWAELAGKIVVEKDRTPGVIAGKMADFMMNERPDARRWLRYFEVVDAAAQPEVLGIVCVFMVGDDPYEVHWVSM